MTVFDDDLRSLFREHATTGDAVTVVQGQHTTRGIVELEEFGESDGVSIVVKDQRRTVQVSTGALPHLAVDALIWIDDVVYRIRDFAPIAPDGRLTSVHVVRA